MDQLARLDALVAAGLHRRTVRGRIQRGWWTEPLPGVVCRHNGALTAEQEFTSAVLYGGEGATLSCLSAGALHGFGTWGWPVHLVVQHGRHLRSTERVVVHQTRRAFTPDLLRDWLVSPAARAAVDAALETRSLDEACSLLGRVLQRTRVSAADLAQELDAAPSRGSRLPRLALTDVTAGAHAASEARLVRLVAGSTLPLPEYNAAVGTSIGVRYIDALWRYVGKGVEIDGAAVHLDASAWRRDLVRQNAIQSAGVTLLRIAARRLWTEPDAVLAELSAFLTPSAQPS